MVSNFDEINHNSDSIRDGDSYFGSESSFRAGEGFEKEGLIPRPPGNSPHQSTSEHMYQSRARNLWMLLFFCSFVVNIILFVALLVTNLQPHSRLPPWPLDVYCKSKFVPCDFIICNSNFS
jgi:hypothetical protein